MTVTKIPPPLDDDADDVVWALQTAQVQWRRGAKADAVVWLRRAVDAAIQAGNAKRALELNGMIAAVEERLVASVFDSPEETTTTSSAPDVDELLAPPPSRERMNSGDVDDLLGSIPPRGPGVSIDIEFEEVEMVDRTDVMPPKQTQSLLADSVAPLTDSAPPPAMSSAPAPTTEEEPLPRFPSSSDGETDAATLTHHVSITGEIDRPTFADEVRFTDPSPPPIEAPSPPPPARAGPTPPPPPRARSEAPELLPPAPRTEPADAPVTADDGSARIDKVNLADVAGLQDLPPEAQLEFAQKARREKLDVDEEVGSFAVALVVEGWASIMPTIADVTCAFAQAGEVVFTDGTLEEGVALRVVAGETDTVVAVWDKAALAAATADCPWVADELRIVADRFQALAGAGMGPLGDRLDDSLRQSVTDRCEVRTLLPGEEIVDKGAEVPGMFIVGGGSVEIVSESGEIEQELGPGDFLFAASVMSAMPAPAKARAAQSGALVLFAERMAAHELIVTVPPLLEILAS
jgi:CRP-like cAMP-binding protein